jgi:hypothetical protein
MIAKRRGSSPYRSAFARSHRMAALMSYSCPGNWALALERIATPATAKPSGFRIPARASAPWRPFSASHPDPWLQMTSGVRRRLCPGR